MLQPFDLRSKLRGAPLLIEATNELNFGARELLLRSKTPHVAMSALDVDRKQWQDASVAFVTEQGAAEWQAYGLHERMPARSRFFLLQEDAPGLKMDVAKLGAEPLSIAKHGDLIVRMVNIQTQNKPVIFIAGVTPSARAADVATGIAAAAFAKGVFVNVLKCSSDTYQSNKSIDAALDGSGIVIVTAEAPMLAGAHAALERADRSFLVADDSPIGLDRAVETVMEMNVSALYEPKLVVTTSSSDPDLANLVAKRLHLDLAGTFPSGQDLGALKSGPQSIGAQLLNTLGLEGPGPQLGFGL